MTIDDAVLSRNRDRSTTGALALIVAATFAAGSRADEPPKPAAAAPRASAEEVAFFETSIRPILVESCQKCHGPKKQSSGLRVDSREALLKGGDLGPAVIPGKPDESPLVKAVLHHDDDLKMPPDRKLPDPAKIGNAGSFFKNPIVSRQQRDTLLAHHPQLVNYAQPDGSFKLAAGWLIDQSGWKGRSLGAAGVYEKQALVLVNRGGASGQEIAELAAAIQSDVQSRFGVTLEPEPVFV